MSSTALRGQIIKGGIWITLLEASSQVLQFVKTFYAAKILTPSDFGIVGFAFLIITLIDVFSTTGMKEAIIQSKEDLQSYLSTVWTIELAKGSIILIVVIALTWLLTLFSVVDDSLVIYAIMFVGVVFFIQCTTNIGVVYFEKSIQFHKFFIYQFCGTITDVIVSISLVYYFHTVWALFFGIVAGALIKSILSFILVDFVPKIQFDKNKAKYLLGFGKWILGSRIVSFLGIQIDSILVSSFLGMYSMGIYQMALRIGNLPVTQGANILGRIVFPVFSKSYEDISKLKEYFLHTITILSVLFMLVVILIVSLIPEFTELFLNSKWIDIVPIVRILILSGYIRIIATIIDYYFWATNQPKISTELQSTRTIILIVFIIPLSYYYGIIGVALSGLVSILSVTVFYLRKVCIQLRIGYLELANSTMYPFLLGILMSGAVLLMKTKYSYFSVYTFFGIIIGITLTYVAIGLLLGRYTSFKSFGKLLSIVKSYVRNENSS